MALVEGKEFRHWRKAKSSDSGALVDGEVADWYPGKEKNSNMALMDGK